MSEVERDLSILEHTIADIRQIISQGRDTAYQAVNASQVMTYWRIGKRITEQEQHGFERAEYGSHLIEVLSIMAPVSRPVTKI